MNIDYYKLLGWTLLLVAGIFSVGLSPSFARHFYPSSPRLLRRLAAPLIFGGLAAACLTGAGYAALFFVILLGLTQIALTRWRRGKDNQSA
jgi:hypothetical protein